MKDRGSGPTWIGAGLSVLVAAAVLLPPLIYQYQHFFMGWHDAGAYVRANWNVFEFGRFAVLSDGTGDFFREQHFEPFFYLLCLPVRLWGLAGFAGAVTGALMLSAGFVYALSAAVTRSSGVGLLAAAAFVANPYTMSLDLNYRVESFGVLFLLAFAFCSYRGHVRLAWLALGLSLIVKEDMWVYGGAVALLVSRPGRRRETAAFCLTALAYYLVGVRLIGGWLYPAANYLNTFYQQDGHPMTSLQIAGVLLGRWREFIPLLVTGPGLLFQLTLLFVGVWSGWRYVITCAVMLIWLTYPEGPPRSNFAFYYAYPALLLSFVNLPFALNSLGAWWSRLAAGRTTRARPATASATPRWLLTGVMGVVLAVDVTMHVPGFIPAPIEPMINPHKMFGVGPGVRTGVVASLIDQHLTRDSGSVLAQFFVIPRVPQRPGMYVTFLDAERFLSDQLKPRFVLLDLRATDPYTTADQLSLIVDQLRYGDRYLPLYDAADVLLYERRDPSIR